MGRLPARNTSRTTDCGRWLTARNIRPMYSPDQPEQQQLRAREHQQRRHQPAESVARRPQVRPPQPHDPREPTIPATASMRPTTVATRSGSTEKFTHALSQSRTSRRKRVGALGPPGAARAGPQSTRSAASPAGAARRYRDTARRSVITWRPRTPSRSGSWTDRTRAACRAPRSVIRFVNQLPTLRQAECCFST